MSGKRVIAIASDTHARRIRRSGARAWTREASHRRDRRGTDGVRSMHHAPERV